MHLSENVLSRVVFHFRAGIREKTNTRACWRTSVDAAQGARFLFAENAKETYDFRHSLLSYLISRNIYEKFNSQSEIF